MQFEYEEYESTTDSKESEILDSELTVYPNPTSDYLNVNLSENRIDKVRIIDMTGKTVFKSTDNLNTDDLNIPVHQLNSGAYLLEVISEGMRGAKTFIVE